MLQVSPWSFSSLRISYSPLPWAANSSSHLYSHLSSLFLFSHKIPFFWGLPDCSCFSPLICSLLSGVFPLLLLHNSLPPPPGSRQPPLLCWGFSVSISWQHNSPNSSMFPTSFQFFLSFGIFRCFLSQRIHFWLSHLPAEMVVSLFLYCLSQVLPSSLPYVTLDCIHLLSSFDHSPPPWSLCSCPAAPCSSSLACSETGGKEKNCEIVEWVLHLCLPAHIGAFSTALLLSLCSSVAGRWRKQQF